MNSKSEAVVKTGLKVVFGFEPCPKLPAGFELRQRRLCSSRAVRDGQEYLIFLEPNRLVPVVREGDGSVVCDFVRGIPF